MTDKKKVILVVSCVLASYLIFFVLIRTLFYMKLNNPFDNAASLYIREHSDDIVEEYGEINIILRTIEYRKIKSEDYMKVPYNIETDTNYISVYVEFEKEGDEWKAQSYEIIEVEERGK